MNDEWGYPVESMAGRVNAAIKAAGKPLHMKEIMEAVGMPDDTCYNHLWNMIKKGHVERLCITSMSDSKKSYLFALVKTED